MQKILLLTSPKHIAWSDLTLASFDEFWSTHPEVIIKGQTDPRDWLKTALTAVEETDADIIHLFLSDHALVGPVRQEGVDAVVASLKEHGAVCYRPAGGNVAPGHILKLKNNEFCLYPGVWKKDVLLTFLKLMDLFLVDDQRTVASIDRLLHAGILANGAGITGNHNLMPLPIAGCLWQGTIDPNYARHYSSKPKLLELFLKAASSWPIKEVK